MKILFITVFLLTGSSVFCGQRQLPSTASQTVTEKVVALLDSDSLPKSDFKAVPIKEVISWLQKNHKENGPSGGISYFLKLPDTEKPTFTGSLSGMNLSQALETICSQTDLYWWITSSAVFIAPKEFHTAEQGAAANP